MPFDLCECVCVWEVRQQKKKERQTDSHSQLPLLCLSAPPTWLLWKQLPSEVVWPFYFGSHHERCLFYNKIITRQPGGSLIPRMRPFPDWKTGLQEVHEGSSPFTKSDEVWLTSVNTHRCPKNNSNRGLFGHRTSSRTIGDRNAFPVSASRNSQKRERNEITTDWKHGFRAACFSRNSDGKKKKKKDVQRWVWTCRHVRTFIAGRTLYFK